MNFITTIIQLRAPGMTWFRLPFFVWAQFITAFLLLLAFPALQAAAVLQGMDRLAGTSFFLPSGLVVSGQPLDVAGGGNALLWQHLFWFLGHPEVYVLILPAMGIIAEVIANNTRKPLWGYRLMVYSMFVLGFLSFVVWAHHMFLTGMGTAISAFFQATTMIISIPSVIILSALILSLYGGSIRFNTPMLFALAFMPMFGLGGLTGLPLGLAATDIPLHDTNYVVAHFHYLVAPGTIFALFAGIYYWFPKITGRMMNETLGKIHFVGSLVCMNVIFMPMFIQGLAGVNRRLWDGGAIYTHAQDDALPERRRWSYAAFGLGFFQLFFIVNLFVSIRARPRRRHEPVGGDDARVGARRRRRARTATSSGRCVSTAIPTTTACRAPPTDFLPQNATKLSDGDPLHHRGPAGHRADQPEARDLAVPRVRGDALRLAVLRPTRCCAAARRRGRSSPTVLSVPLATLNTVVLIASSVTMVMAWASLAPHTAARGKRPRRARSATGCSWA